MSLSISSLFPPSVKVNWEGRLTIYGRELGKPGFVEIDGIEQAVVSWSANAIVVTVTKATTANAGDKRLVVHDDDGGFAETRWLVEP